MAEASKRAAALTELVIGKVRVPVGLYTTTAKPGKLAEFQTAGPNGGVLFYDDQAKVSPLSSDTPVPEMRVQQADPFADDPGSDTPPPDAGAVAATASKMAGQTLTPGEFRQVLVEEGSGVKVEKADVRRGVRHDDGSFTDLTAHLQRIEQETRLEQMEVVDFIDVGTVERARIEASYYIGAGDAQATLPLRLVYEAMKLTRRVAVVKWSARSRQSLGVLTAHGNSKCLVLLKLAWAEDWREPPAKALSVSTARVSAEQITMAVRLIEAMSGKAASLAALRDDAIVLREELHAAALAGKVEAVEPEPAPESPIDMEDAFAASLAELMAAPRAGKG